MKTKNNYVFWNSIQNEFQENIDFSREKTGVFAEHLSTQLGEVSGKKQSFLSSYAFQFYAYNEILSKLRESSNGVLNEKDIQIFGDYKKFVDEFSQKLVAYILYSCVAEARYQGDLVLFKSDELASLYEGRIEKAYLKEQMKLEKNIKKFKEYAKKTKIAETEKNYVSFLYSYEIADEFYFIPKSFKEKYIKENGLDKEAENKALDLFAKNYSKIVPKENKESFKKFVSFMGDIKVLADKESLSSEDGDIHSYLYKNKFLQKNSKAQDLKIGDFFKSMECFFLKGFEYGYGGKAWSDIASHARKFIDGEMNAEMFIDQAMSLEHNGGHMFNKEFIFKEEGYRELFSLPFKTNSIEFRISPLEMVFDLQNSGQILDFINSKTNLPSESQLELKFKSYSTKKDLNSAMVLISNLHEIKNNLIKWNSGFLNKYGLVNNKKNDFKLYEVLNSYVLAKKNNTKVAENFYTYFKKDEGFFKLINTIVNGESLTKESKLINKEFNIQNLLNKNIKVSKESIGGKAFGLYELNKLGFNVPKAMVFDTKTCLSFLSNKKYFNDNFNKIKHGFDSYLKDSDGTPIMVSVRSGAPISMPGMMDTILNVGIDNNTYPGLCDKYGQEVVDQCAISFMQSVAKSSFGVDEKFPSKLTYASNKFKKILQKNNVKFSEQGKFPLDKESQIKICVEAVFNSWNSERSVAWRQENNIDGNMGTAAVVQKMILGNKNNNSLTAVIFSRDCITGKPGLLGEFLVKHQGEDLVSGAVSPKPIKDLKNINPKIFNEIKRIAEQLEKQYKAIQDIEITVEDGEVFVLQRRNAVSSNMAQIKLAKERGQKITEFASLENILNTKQIKPNQIPECKGLPASPGIISGIVVKSLSDLEKYKDKNKKLIFLSKQALPEHAPLMIKTDAFLTRMGGSTSHAAILARSLKKPCIVGAENADFKSGDEITMDAGTGLIWSGVQPIVDSTKESIEISNRIIKENNVNIKDFNPPKEFLVKSWTTDFSHIKIGKKNDKFKKFLSQQQIVAAIILKEKNNTKNKKGLI